MEQIILPDIGDRFIVFKLVNLAMFIMLPGFEANCKEQGGNKMF